MSRPFPDDPFLRDNYGPWPMEGEIHDLVVEGEIPRELNGTLYRNGPNPQFAPRGCYHWFDGDGMIHAFTIRDGKARYRNRWVRTERFKLEREAGEALFGGLNDMNATDPRVMGIFPNAANTNIIVHAGKLLALWEAGPPHELDPHTLDTIGPYDFAGKLVGPMTAHPKIDPETGELLFFGYSPFPPYLRYHVASADGQLVRSEEIDVPVPTMMHDFITTRDHVIFMVCPATFRFENLTSGVPIRWEPELGTKIGVMPRNGGSADVIWFETDPCYVFHPMNAYTENGRVIADVCRFDRLPLFDGDEKAEGFEKGTVALLTRWTLDLAGGTVKEERMDDSPSEFPRLDERYTGLRYRHGYASGRMGSPINGGFFNAIVHYDHKAGGRRVHDLGPTSFTSEPVFVPRSPQAPEGEGFLLTVIYRHEEQRSDLLILDAANVEGKPLATVKLPHRVPYGFHGNWGQGL
ncbi:MAG: carotenoid oxygenase family protein [Deltaproteobacteria bacterium]|nr:carotenoid oxygenase family protein [Deltaproteobacteria bacterium]